MRLKGVYLPFSDRLELAANRELQALARKLLASPLPGVTDIIPGYSNLYTEFDADVLTERKVRSWLEQAHGDEAESGARTVHLPVHFDGEDLPHVAAATGLSEAEVVARFTAPTYHVYAVGFMPGFPFLGEVDPALRLPRRGVPRPQVPANTVAIANAQAGIYPLATPGGWHLLGTSLTPLYDPLRERALLLAPGDSVTFSAATERPSTGRVAGLDLLPTDPDTPFLRILEPGLLDIVVDGGRLLAGRFGFGRGGALDAPLASLANRLVGNPPGTPLVELSLLGGTYEVLRAGVIAVAGRALTPVVNGRGLEPFTSFTVRRGDILSFTPQPTGSRSYLAVAGGIASARFMGSASVDLRGKVGRSLAAGDILGLAREPQVRPGRRFVPYARAQNVVTLRLQPGPQANPDALAALTAKPFTVGRADRTGLQLAGSSVPGGDVLSEAVPLGAVQLTASGLPLLLLNDRGTLGGYSKPAVLHSADLAKAAQLRPGQAVRFSVDVLG